MPLSEPYKIFTENEKVCNGCNYNDGGAHAECIVCDKEEKMKRTDCFDFDPEFLNIFNCEDNSTVPAHWIDQGHKIFKCSNCGNYLDFRGVNAGRGAANYCPNCGAKMWNIPMQKTPKRKVMFFKKKSKLTKREEEIRRYIFDEYTKALCIVAMHETPETIARKDEASKILGKILDILGYEEDKNHE